MTAKKIKLIDGRWVETGEDASDIVRDGEGIRAPVQFMDSARREMAEIASRAFSDNGNGGGNGRGPRYGINQPGFASEAALDMRDMADLRKAAGDAFDERTRAYCNAWRDTVAAKYQSRDSNVPRDDADDHAPSDDDLAAGRKRAGDAYDERTARLRDAWKG